PFRPVFDYFKNENSVEERIVDVGEKYLLFLFAVQLRMKRVWQPRSEIRAKTAKTWVLGSSLSPSRSSAAILVSGRSDRARSSIF
ncbi:unnamed protein product, partial [Porites evermanni]